MERPRSNLPLEPLQRFYGKVTAPNGYAHNGEVDSHVRALAEIAGVDPRQIHRWRHNGLGIYRADRVAAALGAHPSEIWTEWFDAQGV